MPITSHLAAKLTAGTTHQAVCRKGDYYGPHRNDPEDAERDAEKHCSKPDTMNHVVSIITTTKSVENFIKNKS